MYNRVTRGSTDVTRSRCSLSVFLEDVEWELDVVYRKKKKK